LKRFVDVGFGGGLFRRRGFLKRFAVVGFYGDTHDDETSPKYVVQNPRRRNVSEMFRRRGGGTQT
jgi:hypothetical protein